LEPVSIVMKTYRAFFIFAASETPATGHASFSGSERPPAGKGGTCVAGVGGDMAISA